MEINESVKDLKCLCLEKIVDKYEIDINFSNVRYLNNAISVFQKVNPSLSVQNFYKNFNEKESDFSKFLFFFYYYVWNSSVRSSLVSDDKETMLTNWLRKNSDFLSEVSFVGCKYTKGNLYFGLADVCGHNVFKQHKANKQMIKYKSKQPKEIKNNCHKLVRLTVLHNDFVKGLSRWSMGGTKGCFFMFFDLDRGTLFHFSELLKLFGYPAFTCQAETYHHFKMQLVKKVANHILFYKHDGISTNTDEHLNFVKFVSKTKNKKCRKSFKRFKETLVSLTHLEEIELNLIEVSDSQKVEIIESLNKDLKRVKVLFCQPFNFILFLGKRFQNLQTLEVAFSGKDRTIFKDSKYFNKLNWSDMVVFSDLKCLKLHFTWRFDRKGCFDKIPWIPYKMKTIFTILEGCQNSLTNFEWYNYSYYDVSHIINFICLKNMPLKYIKLSYIFELNNADVLNIVKMERCDDLKIFIESCWRVTKEGISAALAYINLKKMNKTIEYIDIPY